MAAEACGAGGARARTAEEGHELHAGTLGANGGRDSTELAHGVDVLLNVLARKPLAQQLQRV